MASPMFISARRCKVSTIRTVYVRLLGNQKTSQENLNTHAWHACMRDRSSTHRSRRHRRSASRLRSACASAGAYKPPRHFRRTLRIRIWKQQANEFHLSQSIGFWAFIHSSADCCHRVQTVQCSVLSGSESSFSNNPPGNLVALATFSMASKISEPPDWVGRRASPMPPSTWNSQG